MLSPPLPPSLPSSPISLSPSSSSYFLSIDFLQFVFSLPSVIFSPIGENRRKKIQMVRKIEAEAKAKELGLSYHEFTGRRYRGP